MQKVLSPGVWLLCCTRLKLKDHLIYQSETCFLLLIYNSSIDSLLNKTRASLKLHSHLGSYYNYYHYRLQPMPERLHTLAAVLFLKVIAAENGERPDLSLAVRSMPGQPSKTIMIGGGCYFCFVDLPRSKLMMPC